MSDRLAAAVERLAEVVEQLAAATLAAQLPDDPCVRCAGKGRWAPGVPCDACGGSGKQRG